MLLDAHEESTTLLPQTVLLAAEGCDALDGALSALRSSGIVELVELDGNSLEARIEEVTPSLVIAGPGVNSAIIGALARKSPSAAFCHRSCVSLQAPKPKRTTSILVSTTLW